MTKIDDAIKDFINYCVFEKGLSDKTKESYTNDLEVYRDKLRGLYVDIEENRPGPLLFNSDELEEAIVNIDQTEKDTEINNALQAALNAAADKEKEKDKNKANLGQNATNNNTQNTN